MSLKIFIASKEVMVSRAALSAALHDFSDISRANHDILRHIKSSEESVMHTMIICLTLLRALDLDFND